MDVRLRRHDQVSRDSGADRAADALASSCANTALAGSLQTATSLRDAACTAYNDGRKDGTAYGSAVVRRGADLLWVEYYTHPGAAGQAQQAVTETTLAAPAGVQ
ncbi:hypothetical protein [Nocardia sp. NPDC005998]|uniref:hypothetical protein n=1 Tax=Nocardia sp. NPDC005998 TaxID=3156894 RepID=UPI0033B9FA7B